ncbi:hypothetical protein MLD38_024958 [Melastoma candidum]|uniref:Uncharacterized protein n=1 Tax=Melastoma candidum TaxID=119954 RepID=A0ACB9NVH4_9MYRT|nr:hypothetical protein MLD38_024958 [Melastoma candidum]
MPMTSPSEYEGEELEAMRPSDSSWHPCMVYLSTFGNCLFINYGYHEPEDMVVTEVEVLERLRFRSSPLRADDCARIDQGEHVLVAHQSPSKNGHYDATVKKVLRVRHSKRNNCNCTFVIEFLEREGECINITSDSIMRLQKKNVKLHPVVCKFLNVIKGVGESTTSLLVKVDHVADTNENSNGVFGGHIKEICDGADVSKNDITTTTILGLKDEGKPPLQRRLIDEFNRTDRNGQVTGDMENQKIILPRRDMPQLVMNNEGVIPSVPSISELPKNKFRLSPLGTRAALASLVSTFHAPMENDTKLPAPSILIHGSIVNGKATELLSKSNSSYTRADVARSTTEEKLPKPGNPGRITRSAARKISKLPEDDLPILKDVERSSLVSSRRSTRSSGLRQDNEASSRKSISASRLEQQVEIGRKGSEDTDLVRHKTMKSASRKDVDFFQDEDDVNGTVEVHGALSSVALEFVESKSSMVCAATQGNEPVVTKRLTRSAARSTQNSESYAVGLLTESSAVSQRCTRLSGLRRRESMMAGEPEPETSNLVPNAEQKPGLNPGSPWKEKLPSQDGCNTSQASGKCGENKVDGIGNRGQGETANRGQKRKDARLSTLMMAERRISPRLRNLSQG